MKNPRELFSNSKDPELNASGPLKHEKKSPDNISNGSQELENKAELEKEISADYLTSLDFQMDIEDQILEEFSKTKDNNLRESLLSLRKSGEESLKDISSRVVDIFNSNKLVVKLRDVYVEKRSAKIYKELSVQNKLAKAEDYDSFLKLIQSDFWGNSSNARNAIFRVNNALTSITSCFPERTNEIIAIWPKLFSREVAQDYNLFGRQLNVVKEREYDVLENEKDKMEYIKSCDDFVALKCLAPGYSYSEINNRVLDHFDSIILKYPNIKELPSEFTELIFRFFQRKPEEIMSDSRRTDFLFNLWINGLNSHPANVYRSSMAPIFADRIQNCSSEETDKLINILLKNWNWNTPDISTDFGWLIELLPLDNNHIKLIGRQKNISANPIVSLNNDKFLGKNIEGREYELLLETANHLGGGEEVMFLSNLIANYPNKRLGVEENELENILDSLLSSRKERLDINILHSLTELMSRHHWSDNLQKKIFSANDLTGQTLNKILAESDDKSFDWIRSNDLLVGQLQLDFHKKAQGNDLRHYFYEVLDGNRKSDNLDDLIKSYGRSGDFDFDEVRSLFIDNRIDRKYIQYFIYKIDVNYIINGLEDDSADDRSWFLESTIKYGKADGGTKALKGLIATENITDPERRQKLINDLIENILLKVDIYDSQGRYNDTSIISQQVFDRGLMDFLSKEEANYLGKKIMSSALNFKNNSKATSLILENPKRINDFFPDDSEKKEYLMKLFDKLVDGTNSDQYFTVMSSYFKNPGLLSVLDDSYRISLENKIFSLNIIDKSDDLLWLSADMDNNQKNRFIEYFEKNYTVASTAKTYVNSLCRRLSNTDFFFDNQEIYTRVYVQILNDSNLESDEASILLNAEIIFSDDKIKDAFFSNIARWPGIDGTKILELAANSQENAEGENSQKSFSLSFEEVKKISSAVMNNRGLSPRFWKGYLASDEKNPTFYLDDDIFRAGIVHIGEDCVREESYDIVEFLESLSRSKFKFDAEDASIIIRKAFKHNLTLPRFEDFYKYNPALMENILTEGNYYEMAIKADISYSPEFNNRIFDHILGINFSENQIDNFLGYLKKNNNSEMIAQTKKDLLGLNDKQRTIGQLSLLKYDLLDVKESRKLYKEATSSSSENARTQILRSINIIGSMLSNRNNVEQLENFLDKPRQGDIENLRGISDFIEKYNQENKGRSIAVMLFAREYLPDRPLEEVIERVAYNLRKYGEVIDSNSYKNTPDGFRASIGMEYEITSSTAKGYEELTSQASLKSDISLVSQAARIGSGRDAVHEIATRPTDNPYLMLLEIKLLHDIEYIDMNFDRSEDYQKGARGFHLTIGGEKGLTANPETNFLQNAIIAASWGGVQSGESGHKVNGGRGVSLRNREADSNNNINFFGNKTNSVELRSLSIDKQETLQRAVTTTFNGAIAIQAFKECFPSGSTEALNLLELEDGQKQMNETLNSKDKKVSDLARLWIELIGQVNNSIRRHNKSFIDEEMFGYLDEKDVWVDAADFGGEYNRKRFESIIQNIDPTLSLKEYAKTTEIDSEEFFKSFSVQLSDKLIKINNLYLKPGTTSLNGEKKTSVFKGDNANAISMLETTKLGNSELEYYDGSLLDKTVFDTAGEKRKGYYYLQGASELMLTHAVQRALIDFNSKVEKMVN